MELVGQVMATDSPHAMTGSAIELAGADMTRRAAQQVYRQTGIKPSQVGVVELHDCFSANEVNKTIIIYNNNIVTIITIRLACYL
jgi:sterol carrier protein 2